MSRFPSLALLIGLGIISAAGTASSEGAALAWKFHCMTCHGERGKSSESRYPHLAGQNAAYLEARLKYFRSYSEAGNQMNGQAAPLSDDEIAALADHFSRMSR